MTCANIDALLASVRDGTATEAAALDVEEIESFVASYTAAIGDVEQQLPQEQQSLDPLLARATSASHVQTHLPSDASPGASVETALRAWLVTWLADRLTIAEAEVDPTRSFADHGLDSLTAVELAQDLSDHLARPLDETLLWNFGTINALVAHLEHGDERVPTVIPSAPATSPLDEEIARLEAALAASPRRS